MVCSNMQQRQSQPKRTLDRRRISQTGPLDVPYSDDDQDDTVDASTDAGAAGSSFRWLWGAFSFYESSNTSNPKRQSLQSAVTTTISTAENVLCAPLQDEGSSTTDSSVSSATEDPQIDLHDIEMKQTCCSNKIKHQELQDARALDQYMRKREMTVTQEKWNALTMIPNPLYCIYFLLSGNWVDSDLVYQARLEMSEATSASASTKGLARAFRHLTGFGGLANDVIGDSHGCLHPDNDSTSLWGFLWLPFHHHMPALPPLPVVAVAVGIVLHAPFSFLYHYKYAHELQGTVRTLHWSRRTDQAMIHAASALMAYATSGSWDYFVANLLFNGDCIYRQFQTKVRPRRNQIRIGISILAYCLPVLKRGDFELFGKLWLVLGVSGWLFGTYPIGGWSHCAFHLVIALLPPLLMNAACELPSAADQMKLAAECTVYLERMMK